MNVNDDGDGVGCLFVMDMEILRGSSGMVHFNIRKLRVCVDCRPIEAVLSIAVTGRRRILKSRASGRVHRDKVLLNEVILLDEIISQSEITSLEEITFTNEIIVPIDVHQHTQVRSVLQIPMVSQTISTTAPFPQNPSSLAPRQFDKAHTISSNIPT
jgi:hypothetical protein